MYGFFIVYIYIYIYIYILHIECYYLTDQGAMSYSNLRRRNQLFTVTATSCNGETATKNMTFFPKYSEWLICYDDV